MSCFWTNKLNATEECDGALPVGTIMLTGWADPGAADAGILLYTPEFTLFRTLAPGTDVMQAFFTPDGNIAYSNWDQDWTIITPLGELVASTPGVAFRVHSYNQITGTGGDTGVRYDISGNVLWSWSPPPAYPAATVQNVSTINRLGDIFVFFAADASSPGPTKEYIVAKYTSLGELLWTRTTNIGGQAVQTLPDAVATANGGVLHKTIPGGDTFALLSSAGDLVATIVDVSTLGTTHPLGLTHCEMGTDTLIGLYGSLLRLDAAGAVPATWAPTYVYSGNNTVRRPLARPDGSLLCIDGNYALSRRNGVTGVVEAYVEPPNWGSEWLDVYTGVSA